MRTENAKNIYVAYGEKDIVTILEFYSDCWASAVWDLSLNFDIASPNRLNVV